MENKELRELIDAFLGYKELMAPVQGSLVSFIETYDLMRDNIERLNLAFGSDIKEKLEYIYKSLSSQAEKSKDLSSRIEEFSKISSKYTQEVSTLIQGFNKISDRLNSVNEIEAKAENQLSRLDSILEEKSKTYNIKDLQRTLESYNNNVQRVSDYINKDVTEVLIQNQKKLDVLKNGVEDVIKRQRDDSITLENLLLSHTKTSDLIQKIAESEDVNEEYLFEALDKWANSRKVKIKK